MYSDIKATEVTLSTSRKHDNSKAGNVGGSCLEFLLLSTMEMKTQTELGIYSHRKIAFSLEVYLKRETTNNRK